MHSREEVYRKIWQFTDRHGMIQKTQRELAEILGLPYQRVCVIFSDLQRMGLVKKHRSKFQMMRAPDAVEWTRRMP
jgi:sugar-specific transcriptional regulator TrmB